VLRSWQAAHSGGTGVFLRAMGSTEGDMSDWWFRVSKVRVRHVLHRPRLEKWKELKVEIRKSFGR